MCLLLKLLKKCVNIQVYKVIFLKSNSLLKLLVVKVVIIEGINFSLVIVDEYYFYLDNGVYFVFELGMGVCFEVILFVIMIVGSNVVFVCKQYYDYCCQILVGEESNDLLFVLIYELDDESEVEQLEMWIKVNFNLYVFVDVVKLEFIIQKVCGILLQWVEMLIKCFNIWCQGFMLWMGVGVWDVCVFDYIEDDLVGMECYVGFDLFLISDIISVSYVFLFECEIRFFIWYYLFEVQLFNVVNKNCVIYCQWVKVGWICIIFGDCIDYDCICDDILCDVEIFNIWLVGFDMWNVIYLCIQLQGVGFDVELFL